jgi:pimeloyl-ACP methyl ester carboxylesterase
MGFPISEVFLRWVLGGPEFAESLLPMWHRIRGIVPPKVLAYRLKVVNRIDVRRWLPKLTMPCCYIQATEDLVVPSTAVSDFVAAVPTLEVKSMKGPHFILQARPQDSAATIEQFKNLTTKPCRTGINVGACPKWHCRQF